MCRRLPLDQTSSLQLLRMTEDSMLVLGVMKSLADRFMFINMLGVRG